jgi:hypothetical protein
MTSIAHESDVVMAWLLEEEQPAVRYLTLTSLLDVPASDPRVVAAKALIPQRGWAAEILAQQDPSGWWARADSLYRPKYLATNWMLLVLSDLGLTRDEPGIAKACELWISQFAKPDGGFGIDHAAKSHLCTTGNMARSLVRLGYVDHPKVRSAFEWMADARAKKGGWSCFGSGRNLDSWEPLSAFAVYPRSLWTPAMGVAVALGAEFFLERELHCQGAAYAPWRRFHYPAHYYYDVLVGLDCLTALGYGHDPRLKYALGLLAKKRRHDGRWVLDAAHPDVAGAMAQWMKKHPKQSPMPFALEKVGESSKMITLTALRILHRLEASVEDPPAAAARL